MPAEARRQRSLGWGCLPRDLLPVLIAFQRRKQKKRRVRATIACRTKAHIVSDQSFPRSAHSCPVPNLDLSVFFEIRYSKYWPRFARGLGNRLVNLLCHPFHMGHFRAYSSRRGIERRYARRLRPCHIHAHFGPPQSCSKQGSWQPHFGKHRNCPRNREVSRKTRIANE